MNLLVSDSYSCLVPMFSIFIFTFTFFGKYKLLYMFWINPPTVLEVYYHDFHYRWPLVGDEQGDKCNGAVRKTEKQRHKTETKCLP